MNIHLLESIHLPNIFSGTPGVVFGKLQEHFIRNMEFLSHYMRYNELTLGASILTLNLACIALAEKVLCWASEKFKSEFFQKTWVQHSAKCLFKCAVAHAGLSMMNAIIKLQLSQAFIAVSVVATVALELLFRKLSGLEWKGCCKVSEIEKTGTDTSSKSVSSDSDDDSSEAIEDPPIKHDTHDTIVEEEKKPVESDPLVEVKEDITSEEENSTEELPSIQTSLDTQFVNLLAEDDF